MDGEDGDDDDEDEGVDGEAGERLAANDGGRDFNLVVGCVDATLCSDGCEGSGVGSSKWYACDLLRARRLFIA